MEIDSAPGLIVPESTAITSVVDLMVARNNEIDALHHRLAEAQRRIQELERIASESPYGQAH